MCSSQEEASEDTAGGGKKDKEVQEEKQLVCECGSCIASYKVSVSGIAAHKPVSCVNMWCCVPQPGTAVNLTFTMALKMTFLVGHVTVDVYVCGACVQDSIA